MINNLVIHDVNKWKDVDDTIAEIVPRNNKSNNKSNAQNAINAVDNWSGELDATQLMGTDKCKELQIDFKLIRYSFKSLSVNGLDLSVIESVKI
jgi:predicted hydrolase (HD superfamily)